MRKVCRVCGETKDLSEFRKHKACPDGRAGTCKACRNRKLREQRADPTREFPPQKPRSAIVVNGEKGCSRCGKVLPVSEFWRRSKTASGLNPRCIACVKATKSVSAKPRKSSPAPKKPQPKAKPQPTEKPRRFPPFKGYGLPENRERAYHG